MAALAVLLMKKPSKNVLDIPNYSPIEAVRYFHLPYSTMEYWAGGGGQHALVRLASARPALLSFNNLVEFYVLEGLRKIHHVNMSSIRRAVGYMLNNAHSNHPLADYEIRTEGRYVWFYRDGQVVNASKGGQTAFDAIVTPYLRRVSRNLNGLAQSIIPFTKKEYRDTQAESNKVVEIDPGRCFGVPVLIGSRLTTPHLAGLYRGGDSVAEIARSYGRSMAEVKEAIEWEFGKEIKAA
jgi:uncharacterized protein (DUF433 family)